MISLSPKTSELPLYLQIYQQLKDAISSGALPSNTRILSKRKMAEQLGVSVNTIDTAYSQLLSEGFITSIPKKGYYVCEMETLLISKQHGPIPTHVVPMLSSQKTAPKIDFSINKIDGSAFPYHTWRKLLRTAFNEYDTNLLCASPSKGEPALCTAITTYLYLSRGVQCRPEQVVIGAGTDNLLQILSYILDNSCTIAMENPVYHEACLFFKRMGHRVLSIPIDTDGIPIEPLSALKDIAVYITPSHQFPLGITMPISRRIKLLNWTNREERRYIIEDDYDSEFRYDARPIPSLQSIDKNGKVIYLGSFSKSITPALRISYMVLPEELLSIYQKRYTIFSCAVSKLDQLVLTRFLSAGHYETHLNKMRKIYKEKRAFFVSALSEAFGEQIEMIGENAGHHVLIQLKKGLSQQEMCEKAKKMGVIVHPISPFFMGKPPSQYEGMVLAGYASLSMKELEKGVSLLKKAWL